jgi:hypothetical protein
VKEDANSESDERTFSSAGCGRMGRWRTGPILQSPFGLSSAVDGRSSQRRRYKSVEDPPVGTRCFGRNQAPETNSVRVRVGWPTRVARRTPVRYSGGF